MREIGPKQVDHIAEGAAVLGAGGGGNTYLAGLDLKRLLAAGGRLRVCDVSELTDDALGPMVSGMGAPTVGIERLQPAGRFGAVVEAMARTLGRPMDFVAIGEVGGANALRPLSGAVEAGLPVVDADPMGRAFPELQMCSYMIEGIVPGPVVLNDGKGVEAVLSGMPDALTIERYARALTWAMGGQSAIGLGVLTASQVRRHGVLGTLSLAEEIGRRMAAARREKRPTLEAVVEAVPTACQLFSGKAIDVARRTAAGFARGTVLIDGLGAWRGARLRVEFQNEYLIGRLEDTGEALLTVPDLLVLVEQESGRALGSEAVRYGVRVDVLGLPAPHRLKTEAALRVVGPGAFGYADAFRPLPGDLVAHGGVAPQATVARQ